MIKRLLACFSVVCGILCLNIGHAADLVEVYQQALLSDPIYQQAIAQRFVTRAGVPVSLASILPQINLTANPAVTRTGFSGTYLTRFANTTIAPRNTTVQTYNMTLSLTQTIFDFSKFAQVRGALASAHGADATLNAALQDLMVRVANAYFAVLRDEENLAFSQASKVAFAEQLDQVTQQYQVGLKTVTEVYTAQASYDSAVADVITAQTQLANDRENLRVITGVYYPKLSSLSDRFPLITPLPADMEKWVQVSLSQNWAIKASRWNVETARQGVKQQVAGHLPIVNLQAKMDRLYERNVNNYNSLNDRHGPGTQTDRQVALNINVPLFSGGGVVAATNQAIYNYEAAQQSLEQTIRNTTNTTRQSYLGVIAGISKIKADQQTIKSTISSLHGMEESYKVGTETLVNVLNQQQKVFQAQTQYATDRYKFVTDILTLKQAAGTLSFDDLCSINAWLTKKKKTNVATHKRKKHHHKKKYN